MPVSSKINIMYFLVSVKAEGIIGMKVYVIFKNNYDMSMYYLNRNRL